MTVEALRFVFIGLSLSSSWGNGHATTYRALLRALARRGHEVLFLECDRPWYAQHRDLVSPDFCKLAFYHQAADLTRHAEAIRRADAVIIGSYVADGCAVAELVRPHARVMAFYDIDTPVTLAMLTRGSPEYISQSVIPLYDIYLSFTGGPTLDLLERRFGARAARALYCAVDAALYPSARDSAAPMWDLGYLGTYSPDRQPKLEMLLLSVARHATALRFVVAGPQYPQDIDWPRNVERIEHLPPAEHAAFYNAQAWTLNITRADMVEAGFSPSVRLFEASACATPIISDDWQGLDDFLTIGREVEIAANASDVLECLGWPPERRRQIGEAARARTLAAHTAEHRAVELEAYIAECRPKKPLIA